jgi:hypothetical protein
MSLEEPVVEISIGVLAWNEEEAIATTLDSLFQQSLFADLHERRAHCEIFCVANGCTDSTPALAARVFADRMAQHPFRAAFSGRVVALAERGKANAWNVFVHQLSSRAAKVLFVMDADILLATPHTLRNMYQALLQDAAAHAAIDQPLKDIAFKTRKSLRERLSLATSRLTQADGAQLTGQLYCLRAEVARRIVLPRDLLVEDGFIKTLLCTDFLTRPSNPRRIVQAKEAAHVFEAYTSAQAILRNQKRQMIGQTIVHLLLDKDLKDHARHDSSSLEDCVRTREAQDPLWLRRLTATHLQETKYFWRLFPGIPSFRFKRLAKMRGWQKLACLPAATAGAVVTLVACWMARRFLKSGFTVYWPDTHSPSLKSVDLTNGTQGAQPATALLTPGGA